MNHPSKLPLVLLTIAVFSIDPHAAAGQAPDPSGGAGIWIEDASGSLRQVPPATRTFLRDAAISERAVEVAFLVESRAGSASGALSAAELAVQRVKTALSRSGIAVEVIRSEVLYVEPRYRDRVLAGSWETPRLVAFDAAFVVTANVLAAGAVGRAVDVAMGAGATRVLEILPPRGR